MTFEQIKKDIIKSGSFPRTIWAGSQEYGISYRGKIVASGFDTEREAEEVIEMHFRASFDAYNKKKRS